MKLPAWFWPYIARSDYLAPDALVNLRQAILDSPYLADTDLNAGFAGTYGFSLLFHREHIPRAQKLIPALGPYLDKVVHPQANVLFFNPLIIYSGKGVEAHADKTLVSFVKSQDPPYPFCVSVLYLQVPPVEGGQLVLHRWFGHTILTPVENVLVEFPGHLIHQVTPLPAQDPPVARVSLVLEQYALKPEMKAEVPDWYLETSRPFDEFLEEAADQEPDPDLRREDDG